MNTRHFSLALILVCLLAAAGAAQRRGGGPPADALSFRFLGPVVGNRVAAIAGVPGDPTIYYAGAASGGVWKTSDGGENCAPIFDSQPVAAICAPAVSAANPNNVSAGTRQAWAIPDTHPTGDHQFKST